MFRNHVTSNARINPSHARSHTPSLHTQPCGGSLFCLDSNATYVVASGVDRVAYYYDPRKWCTVGAWKSVLKLEVAKLYVSSKDDRVSYAFGKVDGEVCEWVGWWVGG